MPSTKYYDSDKTCRTVPEKKSEYSPRNFLLPAGLRMAASSTLRRKTISRQHTPGAGLPQSIRDGCCLSYGSGEKVFFTVTHASRKRCNTMCVRARDLACAAVHTRLETEARRLGYVQKEKTHSCTPSLTVKFSSPFCQWR